MSHAEHPVGPAAGRSWISVGELGEAFGADADSHTLPPSSRLAGTRMTLRFEDDTALDYRFRSEAELVDGTGRVESYRATEIRPGILFVDLILSARRAATISPVLDLDRGICTALESTLPEEAEAKVPLVERVARGEELTSVQARFLSGAIDAPFGPGVARHTHTRELIGRRIEYSYGPIRAVRARLSQRAILYVALSLGLRGGPGRH